MKSRTATNMTRMKSPLCPLCFIRPSLLKSLPCSSKSSSQTPLLSPQSTELFSCKRAPISIPSVVKHKPTRLSCFHGSAIFPLSIPLDNVFVPAAVLDPISHTGTARGRSRVAAPNGHCYHLPTTNDSTISMPTLLPASE